MKGLKKEIRLWVPLWKTFVPKPVDRDEQSTVEHITFQCGLRLDDVSTVLDIKGRKMLRVNLFKDIENGILMYEYLFFGPLTFSGKSVSLVQRIPEWDGTRFIYETQVTDIHGIINKMKSEIEAKLKAMDLREAS